MQRQRVDWVGEQTRDDQTFTFTITDTGHTSTDFHMRSSILSTVQADDRPIVDYLVLFLRLARKHVHLKIQVVDLEQTLNLRSAWCEPPRHHGALQAADGSEIRVNFEVTDATRTDPGAMTRII